MNVYIFALGVITGQLALIQWMLGRMEKKL